MALKRKRSMQDSVQHLRRLASEKSAQLGQLTTSNLSAVHTGGRGGQAGVPQILASRLRYHAKPILNLHHERLSEVQAWKQVLCTYTKKAKCINEQSAQPGNTSGCQEHMANSEMPQLHRIRKGLAPITAGTLQEIKQAHAACSMCIHSARFSETQPSWLSLQACCNNGQLFS